MSNHPNPSASPPLPAWSRRLVPLGAFALSAAYAVREHWQLPELCWSFWLAGLGCCLTLGALGALRVMCLPVADLPEPLRQWPLFTTWPVPAGRLVLAAAGAGLGYGLFFVYTRIFGFYGIFLSVFAEMEPHRYFGRNGFINSDFISPVLHLLERYWPMALGAVVSELPPLWRAGPRAMALLPLNRQLVPIHLMVIGVPFISILCWLLVRDRYQAPAVVLILALFYFFPRRDRLAPAAPPR